MKQQNSRMVVEVNKLIANALLTDGGVYLPQIGSLTIITNPLEAGDAAPTRDIIIREEESHKSLIKVISQRGNCTPQQAEQVYNRWRDVVVEENKTTIFGIGEVSDGKFTITPQMYAKLNPIQAAKQNTKPAPTPVSTEKKPEVVEPKKVEPKRVEPQKVEPKNVEPKKTAPKKEHKKRGGYLWIIPIIALIIIALAYYFYNSNNGPKVPSPVAIEEVETPAPTETAPKEEMADSVKAAPQTAAPAEEKEKPTTQSNEMLSSMDSSPKYKVVFGVFSTTSNCERAIEKMREKTGDATYDINTYEYYGKYLLTIFESDGVSECNKFIKSDLGKRVGNDLWIYERK